MADNIPGTPGFDPNKPPSFTGAGQGELDLLQQFISGVGPSQLFGEATQGIQQTLGQPGGFGAISQFLPSLKQVGAFLGQAGQRSEAFKKAQFAELNQIGAAGLRNIRAQGGGAGRIGSTVQGVGETDLLSKFISSRAGISAQAEDIRSQDLQRRLSTVLGGLGQFGQLAQGERGQNLAAQQGLAQLAGQQQSAQQQQLMQALGQSSAFRQEPFQAGLDIFRTIKGAPQPQNNPSLLENIVGGVASVAPFFFL